MTIRQAKLGDAAAIAKIWNGMIRDSLATFTSEEKTEAGIARLIADRGPDFWVAEDAGAVCGFVTYAPFRPGPGYAATIEHTVILAPDQMGRGIGTTLMQTAMAQARAEGYHVMVAGISSANPGAVAFHAALGFTQVGHLPQVGRKAGQWLDLIFMQKTLSPH